MNEITRLRFLKLLLASAACAPGLAALGGEMDKLRGDRVGWARLKTNHPYWMRHAKSDPLLMRFFREHTTLNIDPTWYFADVEDLNEMCKFPFLFTQGIHPVHSQTGIANLGEYVRRGGFLMIEACINDTINPDPDAYLGEQRFVLSQALPEAKLVPLARDHKVFHCFFNFNDGPPRTNPGYQWTHLPMFGIMIGERMAGVISFSGLQCGWDFMIYTPGKDVRSMQMLVNIYIYAMTQGG
jgi:hypothetical protein